MFNIKVIGIDLGKSSFHIVAHDHAGREQYQKRLTRTKLLEHLTGNHCRGILWRFSLACSSMSKTWI